MRATPWLTFGGVVDHLTPAISRPDDETFIGDRFEAADVPGLLQQPDFVRYQAIADLNYRSRAAIRVGADDICSHISASTSGTCSATPSTASTSTCSSTSRCCEIAACWR